jgi:hypothetical protein
MNLEFDALLKNQTWRLVPSTSAQNVIGCKWVFRLTRKADGSIERYKARLVKKGFHHFANSPILIMERLTVCYQAYYGTLSSLYCYICRLACTLD